METNEKTTPEMPNWGTKESLILNALLGGTRVTNQLCYQCYGTTELRLFISRLIKRGYEIKSEWVTNENGMRYKAYYMDADYINAILLSMLERGDERIVLLPKIQENPKYLSIEKARELNRQLAYMEIKRERRTI